MTFTATPVKPPIELADLERIDVRVGTILSVEDVPGSDKLVKLTVAFGDHERTILAGMKQERENPKEIEGKQALFVVNLPPKGSALRRHVVRHRLCGWIDTGVGST